MPARLLPTCIACAMALLLPACSGGAGGGAGTGAAGPARAPDAAVAVIAHEVGLRRASRQIEAVGTSRARRSAVIFAETGGEVEDVRFEAGDFVEAGTPLLQLESRREALAVRLAAVEVENAKLVLSRYRRIEDSGAVPINQVDEAQTALDAAQIGLDSAEVALAERTVRAPFAGHLGITDVDPGARITASTEITRLDDRRILFVDFAAPEEIFGRLGIDDAVSVVPFAASASAAEATIVAIDSRIDPASRTVTVRAQLDNAADRLRPGMSFRVLLSLGGESYPGIPEAALLWGSDGPYVWRLDGDRVRRAAVEIVSREDGFVLVRGDLGEGTRIVLEGIHKVRDGVLVRVVDEAGPGAAPSGQVATRGDAR
jgi:RND family efflux transporter MFP subunit